MGFDIILYLVFSLIFALITFGIVRYIMKNKKLDRLHGITPQNRAERREKAAQERADKVTKKAELREAIKSKKAEWKAEDEAFDAQVKENIKELKEQKAQSAIVIDKNDIYLINTGNSGMATAGSGDVLTGIITGLMGYHFEDLTKTVAVSAYINGFAGDLAAQKYGQIGMTSADTAKNIALAIKTIIDM